MPPSLTEAQRACDLWEQGNWDEALRVAYPLRNEGGQLEGCTSVCASPTLCDKTSCTSAIIYERHMMGAATTNTLHLSTADSSSRQRCSGSSNRETRLSWLVETF